MNKLEHLTHEFGPLYDKNCKVLILGSFPSPKSRQQAFYYGHPKNRFWQVMSKVLNEDLPQTIQEKRKMMLKHHIALWDAIEECDIVGASDSSIRNVIPTDIPWLISETKISKIYCAGFASYKYYQKYNYGKTNVEAVLLKSTSPANCKTSVEQLVKEYSQIVD